MNCVCPQPTTITDIPDFNCPFKLKQIQRIAFQIRGDSFDTDAETAPTDIKVLADWQAKIAATDATKIAVSPKIGGNPVITAGDAITEGGNDNSTFNGVAINNGSGPSTFSVDFFNITPEIEKAMKTLLCRTDLAAYLILEGGLLGVKKVDDTEYQPFPIDNLFFSDRANNGFAGNDVNTLTFNLTPGWSSDLAIVQPEFNAVLDL